MVRIYSKIIIFSVLIAFLCCSFTLNPIPETNQQIIYVSGDCKTLFYYKEYSDKEADIFVSTLSGNNELWSAPVKVTFNDYAVTTLKKLGHESIDFYACLNNGKKGKDICMVTLVEGFCTTPIFLSNAINSKYDENNVCISKDGNTLYFSSNRSGGEGEYDLYYSEKTDNGSWGTPQNMGKNTNSENNESSPFILGDNSTLFFSSDRKDGLGGFDIFSSTINDDGLWSEPENAGTLVNTKHNEYGIYVSIDESKTFIITDAANPENIISSYTEISYFLMEFSLISK